MKALKITLLVVTAVLLTVSFVTKDGAKQEETTTYKDYTPKQKVVVDRKKVKLVTMG